MNFSTFIQWNTTHQLKGVSSWSLNNEDLKKYFFSIFWGPHPQHMEVPRLGSIRSCSHWPIPQPQQHQILNPVRKARGQTCVLMDASQIHFCWAMMGTPSQICIITAFLVSSYLFCWGSCALISSPLSYLLRFCVFCKQHKIFLEQGPESK